MRLLPDTLLRNTKMSILKQKYIKKEIILYDEITDEQ